MRFRVFLPRLFGGVPDLCLFSSGCFFLSPGPVLGGTGACASHVCFFGALASWDIGRDCFYKAMLMNLHVDMSIYGVFRSVVVALT
jgi:hypothetical protein